jgi:spermidine synthase
MAVREIVRYPDVAEVTVVELDPAVVRLARTHRRIAELNRRAFDEPRVRVVHADAMEWLRRQAGRYDAVVIDLPDPDETATAKLYSLEFYTLVRTALTPGARVVVQAGSPYFAPRSYWCVEATMRGAGLLSTAYHVDVPAFGDWGFLLARTDGAPALSLPSGAPPMRFLTPDVLAGSTAFPADRPRLSMPVSTLLEPRVLEYSRAEWSGY